MASQLHVKHHFVPQTYLKRWENTDKKVWVYKSLAGNINSPIWKSYTTSSIGYHRHLYTQILNGAESDYIENWFGQEFESPAGNVIGKAISDQKLSKDDWRILIRFLAAQDVRTPLRMLQFIERSSEVVPAILSNVLEGIKEKLYKRDLASLQEEANSIVEKDFRFPLKITTEEEPGSDMATLKAETFIGRSLWFFSIRYLLVNTIKVLHSHKWSIIKPAKGYYWFTSDNPVIKLNYTDKNNYDFLGGWGREKGNIIFPIGPEHAMFVQIGDKPIPKGTRLSVSETLEFRKLIAENSHRMIFSHHQDNAIVTLKNRIINNALLQNEHEELQNWHLRNAELEREYFQSREEKLHSK